MKKVISLLMMMLVVLYIGACGKQEYSMDMKTISYETSSFGVISKATIIDLENGVIKEFYNNDFRKGGSPMSISEIEETEFDRYKIEDVQKFESRFKNSGFFKWKEKYVNENIMDGLQWSLNVEYRDGSSKNVYGSNSWPSNFDKVVSTLNRN
ncbi:hypothetical protein [Enterococcus sp. AZ007]|uniref:hypothetical protein n=1 Tax=Enterococcus sp. AZ007 TaxID=2774839 RepID=UPI003F20804A